MGREWRFFLWHLIHLASMREGQVLELSLPHYYLKQTENERATKTTNYALTVHKAWFSIRGNGMERPVVKIRKIALI